MRADAKKLRHRLSSASRLEHHIPVLDGVSAVLQIGQQGSRSLDANQGREAEARGPHLAPKLRWSMRVPEEGRGREWRQHSGAFDAGDKGQGLGNDAVHALGENAVEAGGPPGDGSGEEVPSRTYDASSLAKRQDSLRSVLQVVEGTEKEYGVD